TVLLGEPYTARFAVLERVVPPEGRVPRIVTRDALLAGRFFEQAIAAGHEGLMAKALGTRYDAGARGAAWLKVKPAHTLDRVVRYRPDKRADEADTMATVLRTSHARDA